MHSPKVFGGAIIMAAALVVTALATTGCEDSFVGGTNHTEGFIWPQSLTPIGFGFRKKGNACRRLGESTATSQYLDDMVRLVGCPGGKDSEAAQAIVHDLSGRIVGEADGVTLILVPSEGQ